MRSRRICSSASLAKSSMPCERLRPISAANARSYAAPVSSRCCCSSSSASIDDDRRLLWPPMTSPRNLVNLKDVTKGYAARTVLADVTLGISAGDRIGVVGRNGDGKSTLLQLIAGARGARLGRGHALRRAARRDARPGRRPRPRRARSARSSSAAAPTTSGWPTPPTATCSTGCSAASRSPLPAGAGHADRAAVSGGERRRIALAKTLLGHPELLLLDEPTNHLDVEGVDWLAHHLAARRGSILVVTHDRWFLDAVCTHTWEVADSDGAPVRGRLRGLRARPRRAVERQAAAREERRQQLIRKELAWLRRGPPARTSKPKFRIEAANALIADEPEVARPRGAAALRLLAAGQRRCIDAEHVSLAYGDKTHPARRHLAPRPGRPLRAGRRQRLRQDVADASCSRASWSRTTGDGRARRDGQARLPLAGHGRDPRPPARARVGRGDQGPRPSGRRPRADRRDALRALRLRRREGPHAGQGPLAAASAGGCS